MERIKILTFFFVIGIFIASIYAQAQPSDSEIKTLKKSSKNVRKGLEYEDSLKYDLAISEFSKAMALRPDWPEPYYHRGRIYSQQKKNDKALEDFDKALLYDPVYFDALMGRANLHMQNEEFEKAFADYKKAVEIKPESLRAHYNYVIAAFLTNHNKSAKEHIEYVIENDEENEYPDIYLFKGRIHYAFGEFEESLEVLNRYIKNNPDDAAAYRYRSETFQALGEYEKAFEDSEKAKEIIGE